MLYFGEFVGSNRCVDIWIASYHRGKWRGAFGGTSCLRWNPVTDYAAASPDVWNVSACRVCQLHLACQLISMSCCSLQINNRLFFFWRRGKARSQSADWLRFPRLSNASARLRWRPVGDMSRGNKSLQSEGDCAGWLERSRRLKPRFDCLIMHF